MKKTIIIATAIIFCAAIIAMGIGTARAAEYPNVAGLKPFTAQTAYLSLVGYIQYLAKNQNGQELSQAEALHIIKMQAAGKTVSEKGEVKKVKKVRKHRKEKKAEVKAEEPKAEVKAEPKTAEKK